MSGSTMELTRAAALCYFMGAALCRWVERVWRRADSREFLGPIGCPPQKGAYYRWLPTIA
jgi:hypothetical protein